MILLFENLDINEIKTEVLEYVSCKDRNELNDIVNDRVNFYTKNGKLEIKKIYKKFKNKSCATNSKLDHRLYEPFAN